MKTKKLIHKPTKKEKEIIEKAKRMKAIGAIGNRSHSRRGKR